MILPVPEVFVEVLAGGLDDDCSPGRVAVVALSSATDSVKNKYIKFATEQHAKFKN